MKLFTGVAFVLGWALVTWAIMNIFSTWWVLPLSVGFFMLGLAGFRLIFTVFWWGLLFLTETVEDKDESA